ncbi:MAG: hypothetical protein QM757_26795 [Paludibaculum sp.]
MKHIILLAALAIGAHAQTYVTVQGPIPTANGSGWSGTIFYSWVGQTCGSTFIAPDRKSVRVSDGVIQGTVSLLAGCPSPYLIEYSGASTGRASWTIPAGMSSPTTIALIQSNYIPNPFYQFSPLVLTVPPGDPAKRCWGKNEAGTAWDMDYLWWRRWGWWNGLHLGTRNWYAFQPARPAGRARCESQPVA